VFEKMLDQIINSPALLQASAKVGLVPGALTNTPVALNERQQVDSGCAC
jgi:hypothetical protein